MGWKLRSGAPFPGRGLAVPFRMLLITSFGLPGSYNAPMPETRSLPRVIAMLLIMPMIGFGYVLFSSGSFVWFNRQYVVSGYLICGAIFLGAGTTMLAAAFGILGSAGRWRFPVQAGSAAMFLSGLATFVGIATKVIPCEGPT